MWNRNGDGFVNIRPIADADLVEVQRVAQVTWFHTYKEIYPEKAILTFLSQAYSLDRLRDSLRTDSNKPHRLFYVVADEDCIVGYGELVERGYAEYELTRIYLLPAFQGKGIGKRLLNQLINDVSPLRRLIAWVEKENGGGRSFYESMQFYVEEEREDHFFGTVTHLLKYAREWE
jgi:ribosomal protein S18 acetylase RimI-like enzyme